MKISTKTRYAIRAMGELAKRYNKGNVSLKEIADSQDISLKYLEQIISVLKSLGLVISEQGKKGGYKLAHDPENITILEIFSSFEGGTSIIECTSSDTSLCEKSVKCDTKNLYAEIEDVIKDTLENKTLHSIFLEQTFVPNYSI